MARQTINIGSAPNDGTGDALRVAFDKINDNFLEVYEDGGVNITVNNPVTSTETTLDVALSDLVGGGGATPNLNEVVIAGGTAISTDEFSSVNFELDASLATFWWLMRKDATDKQTTMYSNPNTIYLLSQTPTKDTYLKMLDGEFSIRERVLGVDDSTTVNFEEPTNTTIIKFPAKAVDGTYTIATLDDITGGATDLAYTPSPTNGIVTSSTGTDATLPLADATDAGLLKPADFTQLSTLATDLASKQDDLTASNVHTFVDGLTAMTTPVDADRMIIVDNSASLAKKITWANIKATLKTYFDTLYATTAQVDLRTRELLQDFTDYTTTGVLTEQIISNQAITANDMKINSWLNFIATLSRTGTTNATVSIYLSTTSNSIAGAVRIGTATMTSTQSLPCFKRDFSINASSVLRGILFTANIVTDEIVTQAQSTTTLTLGSNYYLITTASLNNVADTVTQRAINLKSSK